jgi:hypothetical protein
VNAVRCRGAGDLDAVKGSVVFRGDEAVVLYEQVRKGIPVGIAVQGTGADVYTVSIVAVT